MLSRAVAVRQVCLLLLQAVLLFFLAASSRAASQVELSPAEKAWLTTHPVIRLAPDPDFKPIEFFDGNGTYQGAAADIIRLLEKKLGIKLTIVHLKNWDEAMDRFKKQEVDVLGAMVRTPSREKFALFTDTIVSVPGGIFARSGTKNNLTLNDLIGKKVAVVSNYTAQDVLASRYPGIKLDVVPDIASGLAKASLGMVDAYVENMANATYYSQEAGITNLQIVGKTDFDYRWGIGIRKDWPELQSIINKGLAAISDEERQQAIQRWVHVESMRWQPSRVFIISSFAGLLGVVLLIIAVWNFSLRGTVRRRTASLNLELEERRKAEQALKSMAEGLEGIVRERTVELEQQVEERKRSEQLFRELFQNVADPIYIADTSGKILAANDQACRELGYSKDELLAKHVADIDAVFNAPEMVDTHFRHLFDGNMATFETVHRRKDGSHVQVEIHASLISYDGNRSIMGVARNITERKRAEEERLKLEQQLLHAQKLESLGVLAGGIAHDFNNILMAIIGNADLALTRIAKESPVVENLHRIERAAVQAADLAKQMLAYSGKGKFVVESLDLNRLLEEMLHMLEVSISKKAVLRLNLTSNLPTVEADATQMRQIIMNIVINASEAIGDRSGVIAITTGCMDCDRNYMKDIWLDENLNEGLYVFLEIADTGCGMDKETTVKIFDPFFTTKFTGRGLGMAAVLGIVRGHKGAIKVYSEPGKGTTFKLLLPASNRPAEIFNHDSHGGDDWKGEGKVLLVDDEETVRGIGREMLQELGFEAITANDGRETIAIFRQNPDIGFVILDLTMPHMDGEQCFRELRQLKPDIRVIVSSGYNEQEVTQRFAGKGLAGFIQKPYKLSVLKEAIRRMQDCGLEA